jgi:hypothetical protein
METDEGRAAEYVGGGGTPSRVMKVALVVGVVPALASQLLRGRWLTAAFFLAVGILFLKGRKIDGWPKPVRVVLIIVYAALAAAMFVQLIQEFGAHG